MPRTATPRAAAAALGLLAGFVLAPQDQGPMDRDVTPYAVAVVWKTSAPPELPDVSGVQADDWGSRLSPAPPAARPAPPARIRPRAPAAKPKPAPRAAPRVAKASAPAPSLAEVPAPVPAEVRDSGHAVALAPRGACTREEAHVREMRHAREIRHARDGHDTREG
jgi:hypothetical protein